MTNPVDLLALARETQQKAEAATPTPWVKSPYEFDDWGFIRAVQPDNLGHLVADVGTAMNSHWPDGGKPEFGSPEWKAGPPMLRANADYIAHARTAAPLLAAEVVRLREKMQVAVESLDSGAMTDAQVADYLEEALAHAVPKQ